MGLFNKKSKSPQPAGSAPAAAAQPQLAGQAQPISTGTSSTAGPVSFGQAIEDRRTYYGIKNESPISDEKIVELVQQAVKYTPTAFNMQTARAVVFFHDASAKVWDTVAENFLPNFQGDEEQYKTNKGKIDGYKAGYGSVAFFEDRAALKEWQDKMPMFAEAFQTWSGNSTGMLQYIVWTALTAEGFGANLQHHFSYVGKVPEAINQLYNIPSSWECTAIMPFGVRHGEPGQPGHPKTFQSIEDRVKIIRN